MKEQKNAGFWLRLLAIWLDILILYSVLKLFFYLLLLSPFSVYFPFEFTLLMGFFIYSTGLTYWKGFTIGKWLLNLSVVSSSKSKLSIIKVFLRETILKLISATVLFMGFFWIGFSKNKKAWHDLLANTAVTKNENSKIINLFVKYGGIILFVLFFCNYLYGLYDTYSRSLEFKLTNKIEYPFMTRSTKDVTEISQLSNNNDSIYEIWLKENGKSPTDYIVEIASKHQVTLIGETHEIKDELDFLNKIIPDLYYKSGIRCIAMECIPRTMNNNIEKLLSGENYDTDLALTIARSDNWSGWGFKEYWDVLETVWKLNKTISSDSEKMRIVGIDEDWEGPYLAYITIGDDRLNKAPLIEKLKAPFIIDDILKVAYRDELMAYNIEEEIIKKNVKAIVWIGSNHIFSNYAYPIVVNGTIVKTKPRMGVFFKQKYGERIFSATLYHNLRSADSSYYNPFIERIVSKVSENGIAFSTKDSPFGMLRDSCSEQFNLFPTIVFQDLYDGFIYLKPLKQLQKCSWTKNFITKEVFLKYKPFYESKLNIDLTDAAQLNDIMNNY